MSGVVNEARTGTPINTISPSSTELDMRMTETTIHAAIAPENRAKTS